MNAVFNSCRKLVKDLACLIQRAKCSTEQPRCSRSKKETDCVIYQTQRRVFHLKYPNTMLTAYGSLRRHVSYRACTNKHHSALSVASRAASFQNFHPKALLSLFTIPLQIPFGRPASLFPTGVQFRAT